MNKPCPFCRQNLETIYNLTINTEDAGNNYLCLRRCPACGKRLLYSSTFSGSGENSVCSETYLPLQPDDAAMLTRLFYQCPAPLNSSCSCKTHLAARKFVNENAANLILC